MTTDQAPSNATQTADQALPDGDTNLTHDRARAFEALFGARMPLPEQDESPRSGEGLPDAAILFARPKGPPEPSPAPAQLPSGGKAEPSPAPAMGLLFTTVHPSNTQPGSGGTTAAAGESYEVGYKKPPKDRRFKKGQSGNKRGRPKRPKGASEALESILSGVVVVRENGKRKRMTRLEAMLLASVSRVTASPDLKGFSSLMSVLKMAGLFNGKSEPQGRTGVLVVPRRCESIEEWIEEYGLEARANRPPPEAYLPAPKPSLGRPSVQ